jgi:hypothetical protein
MDGDPRRHEWDHAVHERVAFCTACGRGCAFVLNLPPECPVCHGHIWQPIDAPKGEYVLTENDRTMMLRPRGIKDDDDEKDPTR